MLQIAVQNIECDCLFFLWHFVRGMNYYLRAYFKVCCYFKKIREWVWRGCVSIKIGGCWLWYSYLWYNVIKKKRQSHTLFWNALHNIGQLTNSQCFLEMQTKNVPTYDAWPTRGKLTSLCITNSSSPSKWFHSWMILNFVTDSLKIKRVPKSAQYSYGWCTQSGKPTI